MVNIGVFKAADNLHDGVDLADVAQKLVAEPLPLAGSLHKPRDIDEFDHGGDEFFGVGDFGEDGEPGIGHDDDPLVGVDGAKWVVGRLRFPRPGDGVKEGGFANVREPDNACA